jgi:ribosomal protein L11 methylase PrmA
VTGERIGSSFRDPSGFLFSRNGSLYRQIQQSYARDYDHLKSSGLYDALVARSLLVPHEEIGLNEALLPGAYRVISPERIPIVSLPYEWCFSELRAAALLTLQVQELALSHGMVLKDASAFNVLFRGTQPVFVDTLSFGQLEEGRPWIAYRQFCQHFLAPLALQALVDIRLRALQRRFLDGVPLDLASRLLPRETWLRPWALLHIHLHARAITRYAPTADAVPPRPRPVSQSGLEGLVTHLKTAVAALRWSPPPTEWADYEDSHGYDSTARDAKRAIVERLLQALSPRLVFDLGANTGEYSRLARSAGAQVVALDGDPLAVERAFQRLAKEGETGILPLWIDLANPSPPQGWAHTEWPSLEARGPADVVLALALLHHLAIGNNVPFENIARFLSRLGRRVIIEWVPKEDPQAQRLLASREDVFADYAEHRFVAAMEERFHVEARTDVASSARVIYSLVARADR